LAMTMVIAGGLSLSSPFLLAAEDDSRGVDVESRGVASPHLQFVQFAQDYGRPPADMGEPGLGAYPADQTEAGQLILRINRLENQMRQINGQIEEMQFETRKLQEQLRKFQEDVDFRFHEGAAPGPSAKPLQKRSDMNDLKTAEDVESTAPGGRGDAFDPGQNPNAPGAPRPLGNSAARLAPHSASDPVASVLERDDDPGAPLDLTHGRASAALPSAPAKQADVSASGHSTPGGTLIAPATNSPREQFDIALAFLKQRSYEDSERGFTSFLAANPKSKLASDAIYYLGETYYLRGRQREAAEQYLKISTHYADSPRAPEALLRLGQSLNALGAKEQACATYSEIGRKYPNAPSMVKIGAEREAKKAQCS